MYDLQESPIIAAVRSAADSEAVLTSPVQALFLLNADLLTIDGTVERIKAAGKHVFVHIDLAEGIGKDASGIRYLAEREVDGIISTRAGMIKLAKEQGLQTVQRFFVMDSHAVEIAIHTIRTVNPDMVEVMPGVVPKVIETVCSRVSVPVIAGGLIETKQEIIQAIRAGASAISTAKQALWYE